jgi:pyrroloquinoline quinone biosynthesis protein D
MTAVALTEASVPRLAAGVKLRHDAARDRWTLLAPERIIVPDEIALEILRRVDGKASVGAICDDLAAKFSAPREVIATDVVALLVSLAEKGFVTT